MSATTIPRGAAAPPSGAGWRQSPMAFDVQMAHHEESQISLHLLAAIPHGTYAECFTPQRDPIYWNMLAQSCSVPRRQDARAGSARLRLGLGPEYIAKYRV